MNDTGSYAARKNAKRAAEKMIVDGKAPAVDYAISRLRKKSRFWKNGHETGSQRELRSN